MRLDEAERESAAATLASVSLVDARGADVYQVCLESGADVAKIIGAGISSLVTGNDVLIGGTGADVLRAGDGDDSLYARGGADLGLEKTGLLSGGGLQHRAV